MVADSQTVQSSFEDGAITLIAVTYQMAWCSLPGEGLCKLLCDSYGYTDAEFKNFVTSSGNFTGNVPNRTPKNTFVSHIQYTYRGWEAGSLSARLDYTRRGAWFDTDANTLERREPAREVINARLAFESKEGNWGVAAWMKNLTDEQYETSFTVGIGPGIGRFHAPPRTYGVELTVDF